MNKPTILIGEEFMSMTSNLRVSPRNVGITGLLTPGTDNISGSRAELFARNIAQTRVPAEPDFPDVFTGFETMFGDYTFDSTKRRNEVRVIAVINKYATNISAIRAECNPMRTIIYRDLKTGEISYYNVEQFTHYTNDYGYENKKVRSVVQVDDILLPEEEIYASACKDGNLYKLGVNANVAFITTLETTEDCFAMSESLAKRLSPTSVETKSIVANMKQYPLNLYGDDDQYKIIPDIGDTVNKDGILCAFRPIRRYSAISDLMPEKLTKVNHLFDKKIYAHPGSKVVDIEIYMNQQSKLPSRVYEQIKIYHEARLTYWREILRVYDEVKNLEISPKFNTLVTRAIGRLLAAKQNVPLMGNKAKLMKATLIDKYNIVTLRIDITLAHKVIVNKGHKSAGREGAKGVVIVKPDNEMPIDEQGFRADICIDPVSVLERTNIIQLYEQYINRVLKWQAMHLNELGSVENQFNRCVEVLNIINPEYARLINEQHSNIELKTRYVEMCKLDTIKICIPPGMTNLVKEMVQTLMDKYNTPISKVEFTIDTSDGKKRVKSKVPVVIGTKYIYLLSKYPKPIASGYGYVNKCHMPVGSKDKNGSPLGTKPIRFGESESRIFAATIDIPTILRLKCLFSGSRIGPKMMIESLMNSTNPSQLPQVPVTTEVLYDDNLAVRIAHHMFETSGIDIQNSLISPDEAEKIFGELQHLI